MSIRVLVVNMDSMNLNNATALTFRSMFRLYDKSNLLEVYYTRILSDNISDNSYQIKSIKLSDSTIPLNAIIRKILGRRTIEKYNSKIETNDSRSYDAKKTMRVKIKAFVQGLINVSPIIVRNFKGINDIDKYKPEIIYTMGGDIIPLRLAIKLSKRYGNIPIILHYMDNWIETKYTEGVLFHYYRQVLKKKVRQIQRTTNISLVISPYMAEYYNLLFPNIKHIPIMNSIDPNEVLFQNRSNKKSNINFTYAGGLHLNRYKQLLEIENALSKIQKSEFNVCNLIIYTTENDKRVYEKLFNNRITVFKKYLPHDEINKIYAEADVLVHIESFDLSIHKYIKYSLSTKISEYMMSGKPILCYTPNDIASYRYIKDNNCGICISSVDELDIALITIIKSQEIRKEFGNNGRNKAIKNHTYISSKITIDEVFERAKNE